MGGFKNKDLKSQQINLRLFIFPGFIVSGGFHGNSHKKVELYNPSSGNSCPIQDLQEVRAGHTSCSGLVCGGVWNSSSSPDTCEKITGTEVSPLPSLKLDQERYHHLCWSLPGDAGDKILLLGGRSSPTTSEVVSGSKSTGSLKNKVGYRFWAKKLKKQPNQIKVFYVYNLYTQCIHNAYSIQSIHI